MTCVTKKCVDLLIKGILCVILCDMDNNLLNFLHMVGKKFVDLLIRDCKDDFHQSLNQFQTKNSIGEFFSPLIC